MTTAPRLGRDVPALVDELATLTSILDHQRAAVIKKGVGLSDEQGRD